MKLYEVADISSVWVPLAKKLIASGTELNMWWTSDGGDSYPAVVYGLSNPNEQGEVRVDFLRPGRNERVGDTIYIDIDKWTVSKRAGDWWLDETE